MWSFLSDLIRTPGASRTIVVMDEEGMGATRQYEVEPRRLLMAWGGTMIVVGVIVAGLMAWTPLRTLIPGYGTEELQQEARLNAIRVSALQDSVAVQRRYIERLQQLMTGQVDSSAQQERQGAQTASSDPSGPATAGRDPSISPPATGPAEALSALRPPVRPPVEGGFPTRGFDAQEEHYGTDIAVAEGTQVRSIGSGYVVMADWIQEGGYTIAVQHADGYLSVYKHNKRLLKQMGDRVQAREVLAVSGNTGERTTGPHVHFELWRNGLAQNPHSYVLGW